MTRYDLLSPRPRKDGKTFWAKIGAAFPKDNGGFSLVFDALPLPDNEGRVTVLMSEAKPREDAPRQRDTRRAPPADNLDDEIPF